MSCLKAQWPDSFCRFWSCAQERHNLSKPPWRSTGQWSNAHCPASREMVIGLFVIQPVTTVCNQASGIFVGMNVSLWCILFMEQKTFREEGYKTQAEELRREIHQLGHNIKEMKQNGDSLVESILRSWFSFISPPSESEKAISSVLSLLRKKDRLWYTLCVILKLPVFHFHSAQKIKHKKCWLKGIWAPQKWDRTALTCLHRQCLPLENTFWNNSYGGYAFSHYIWSLLANLTAYRFSKKTRFSVLLWGPCNPGSFWGDCLRLIW